MSRVVLTPQNPEHEVVCGLDHAMGWFFQVFGPETEDGEENLVVDHDSMFTRPRYSRDELINDIKQYAEEDAISKHCIAQIQMDLDPALGL